MQSLSVGRRNIGRGRTQSNGAGTVIVQTSRPTVDAAFEVRISLVDLLDEIGVRPGPDFSLDRVDNDGHYESGNLRWASRKTQARNRRGRRFFQARNKIPQAIKGQVVEMLFDGVGYRDIARSTGVSRLSVIRIAQANNLADRKRGRKTD